MDRNKLVLITPSLLVLVGTMILSVMTVLPIPTTNDDLSKHAHRKQYLSKRFILTIIHAIPLMMAAYTIHCTVAGRCVLWSYILTGVILGWILAIIVNIFDMAATACWRSSCPSTNKSPMNAPRSSPNPALTQQQQSNHVASTTDDGTAQNASPTPEPIDVSHDRQIENIADETFDDVVPNQYDVVDYDSQEDLGQHGNTYNVEQLVQEYCRDPYDVTFPEDSFGSVSSNMGY